MLNYSDCSLSHKVETSDRIKNVQWTGTLVNRIITRTSLYLYFQFKLLRPTKKKDILILTKVVLQ